MGFTQWAMKNAPGSPGSTARHLSDIFIKAQRLSPKMEVGDIWEGIYEHRERNAAMLKFPHTIFSAFPPGAILENTEGDFPMFVFMIMCLESRKFRQDTGLSSEGLNMILSTIREECYKKVPQWVKSDKEYYLNKGREFSRWVTAM